MIGKPHGKNAVIVLSLLSAGFLAAYIRYRPYIGDEATYTDGSRNYESTSGERIRYAIWDEPEPLDAAVNSAGHETAPALSPDGRFMVFSAGRPGLNADLFVAEMAGGVPLEPRPLSLLNSDFDEIAPAFSNDSLTFASNRRGSAGGLDLYVAPYRDGLFGEAAPLSREVNTAADETDPAPIPGTSAVVFASNRARGARRDFDLYLAVVAPGGPASVSAIDALNSPFDERDPAVTADGLAMAFASDRSGSLGGFDLFRSVQEKGLWLAPEPIPGLNSAASERSPRPSRDGFSMLLSIEEAGAAADLFRARSLELFRIPGRPVGWLEILVLVILLALALLAFLAKRWEKLEVIYRCLLVSLILHLILLLWFREVPVEPEDVTLPERSRAFRVRLAPGSTAPAPSTRERGGDLGPAEPTTRADAVERFESPTPAPAMAAASARAVERAAPAPESAPSRAAATVEPAAERGEASVALNDAARPAERLRGEAPALALGARSVAGERSAASAAAAAPERSADAARAAASPGPAAPSSARALSRVGAEESPSVARRAAAVAPTAESGAAAAEFAVAEPRETIVAKEAGAPEMAVAVREVRVAPDPARGFGSPARSTGPEALAAAAPAASDAAPSRQVVARPEAATADLGGAPAGGAVARDELAPATPSRGVATRAGVALDDRAAGDRAPIEAGAPASESESAAAFLPEASVERPSDSRLGGARPERFAAAPGGSAGAAPAAAPASRALAAADPSSSSEAPSGAPRPIESAAAPGPRDLPAVSLDDAPPVAPPAAPAAPGPSSAGESLPFALAAPKRFEPRAGSAAGPSPSRFDSAAVLSAVESPSAPALRPLASPLAAADFGVAAGAPALDRSRIDATPYKTRFGPEKERALEEHGGSVETEKAVAAGLAYLARMQNGHGYWGSESDYDEKYGHASIGKSGLCLLAFLGAGHTPQSKTQYSDVAEKAVAFFIEVQDERTGHFGYSEAYSHGVATYALAECYAITKDERLRRPLERALGEILRNQIAGDDKRRAGGWGYYYPDGRTFDSWPRASITSWQVMALESARLGGLEVPDAAFDGARRFLLGSLDPRYGYFRYSHDPSRLNSGYRTLPGSTPASLFALALLGEDLSDERYERALDFVSERAPEGYRFSGDDDFVQNATGNIYFWYYGTLALFRAEGERWERWNAAMKSTLLPAQAEDGSWRPIELYAEYAGDSNRNRCYTTAMNVLTLEIYYRYFTPLLKIK